MCLTQAQKNNLQNNFLKIDRNHSVLVAKLHIPHKPDSTYLSNTLLEKEILRISLKMQLWQLTSNEETEPSGKHPDLLQTSVLLHPKLKPNQIKVIVKKH